MKFKMLTKILEKLLGTDEEAVKADMHLPEKLVAFGIALIILGFILLSAFIITRILPLLLFSVLVFIISPFTFLCYKNQRIYILSDEEFEYSTFMGRKTIYKFSDILALKINSDSQTLILKNGKVHIESMAVISDRLAELINKELERASQN